MVSLLLSQGHTDIGDCPLGVMKDEWVIAQRRIALFKAVDGNVIQAAAGSIMSKEGGEHFIKLTKSLSGE